MEDIIWKRLQKLGSSDLNFIHYYQLDVGITYKDIETLYENYISKHYFDVKQKESIFSNNDADKISLKLSLFEPALAHVIEDIFGESVKSVQDNLILFYLRGEESALLLFKSFYPLADFDEVKLPHFCYYLKNQDTINLLNKQFEKNEGLCLMHCSN